MLMKTRRATACAALMVAAILTASCADADVLTPRMEPPAADVEMLDVADSQTLLQMIQWTTPRSQAATASRSVGILGGTVSAGGVTLVIPPLALSRTTKITMTVPAGNYVQVDLQPHGLVFRLPTVLMFPILGTEMQLLDVLREVVGVYSATTPSNGLIQATEVYPVQVLGLSLGFTIQHFSAYAPARGGYVLMGDLKGS